LFGEPAAQFRFFVKPAAQPGFSICGRRGTCRVQFVFTVEMVRQFALMIKRINSMNRFRAYPETVIISKYFLKSAECHGTDSAIMVYFG
jgi:hypothetical protein